YAAPVQLRWYIALHTCKFNAVCDTKRMRHTLKLALERTTAHNDQPCLRGLLMDQVPRLQKNIDALFIAQSGDADDNLGTLIGGSITLSRVEIGDVYSIGNQLYIGQVEVMFSKVVPHT